MYYFRLSFVFFKAIYENAKYATAIAFLSMDDGLHIYYCVDSGTFADLKVHG